MAWHARQLVFIIALAIAAGGTWAGPAATSARADEALNTAVAAAIGSARARIDAGQYSQAVGILRPAIEDEQVPPELMAQGFVYRGIARLELGQLLAALSDFGNAFWLETLPTQLEAEAHVHRARAYARLGRNREARGDLIEAMRLAPDNPRVVAATRAPGLTPPRAGEEPTGAIVNPFTPPESGYAVQLGALVDHKRARGEWERILALHADLLTGLAPRYEETAASGRRLVRLRAGPLATLEASKGLCARLRERGQDCFAVGD